VTLGTAGDRRAMPGNTGDFATRIVAGVTLAAIALLGAVLGGWVTAFVLGIVMSIVHLEWAAMTEQSPWPTAVFTVGLVVALAMITLGYPGTGLVIVGLAILTTTATMYLWRPLGVLYASMLGVGLLALRNSDGGLAAVLLLFAVVWATDTGAFFAGRLIGGEKLWPAISPNKTWAGAIGGLVAGVVAGLVAAPLFNVSLSVPLAIIILLVSVASQAGDLFESAIKRWFDVKDSGSIVPGHGGLMDRVDGLTFAAGLAALIGYLHGGGNVAQGLLAW
jgi:phosphatidate cytidylyltransferase